MNKGSDQADGSLCVAGEATQGERERGRRERVAG